MVRVLFLHPDLGAGGSERLVVDAALALKSKNHTVHILTTHHDPDHCFEETKDGGLQVTTVGDWLPRTLNGRCYELCAVIRMIYLAIYLSFSFYKEFHPDVIFCNKFSACIPFLRLSGDPTIIFYCYFPDRLSTQKYSLMRALYREPLDWLKQKTAGLADIVLVNSKFSAGEFHDTFTKVSTVPQVLHPTINIAKLEKEVPGSENVMINDIKPDAEKKISDDIVFLAFNQFERVKNLQLAIEAFYSLKSNYKLPDGKKVKLVLAGTYNNKDPESVEYFRELTLLVEKLGLQPDEISLLRSPSDKDKLRLFKTSQALVYTPREDHFGLIPIEAMYCQLPVIAVNDGGSVESIVNNETGFLCEATPNDFAQAMFKIIEGGVELRQSLGDHGRRRVVKNYSFKVFAERLHNLVRKQES